MFLKSFRVNNKRDLYNYVYQIEWEKYLDVKGTLAVNSTVHSQNFSNSQFVSLKVKDAIVDRYRDNLGDRPSVDLKFPDLKINVHIDRNNCNISLDSSGESS